MSKLLLFASIVVLVLFLVGCKQQNSPNSVVCNSPFIQVNNVCCLDNNSNSICDVNEQVTVVNQSSAPATETIPVNSSEPINTSSVQNNPVQNEPNIPQSIIQDPGQVNDFLTVFKGKNTSIIFGEDTGAPLVAATINLLTYFVYPKTMDYHTISSTAGLDEFPDSNVILLGNGCNNNFIKELLALDNCYGSLDDNTGIIKMSKFNGNYVLFIMAEQDKEVYNMVNSLVSNKIQITGNEVSVDLSSLN